MSPTPVPPVIARGAAMRQSSTSDASVASGWNFTQGIDASPPSLLRRHIQHNPHRCAARAATDGPGCCTLTRASSPLSSERRTRPLMPPSAAAPPEQYRQKWGLPSDYPMVAPNYAERRSVLAKSIGLGRKPAPVVAPEPVEAPFQPVHRGRPPKQTATEQSIPRMTNGLLRGI